MEVIFLILLIAFLLWPYYDDFIRDFKLGKYSDKAAAERIEANNARYAELQKKWEAETQQKLDALYKEYQDLEQHRNQNKNKSGNDVDKVN